MRQLLLQRHKSAKQKVRYATQQRNYHSAMAPNKKRAFLDNRALKYRTMEPEKKRAYLDHLARKYSSLKPEQKRAHLDHLALKYSTMKPEKKRAHLDHLALKYSTMKPEKKRDLTFANALKYSLMKPEKKNTYKKKQVEMRQRTRANTHSLHYYIEQFNRGIREGPYYICVVCNRLLYRKSVLEFKKEKYHLNVCIFTTVKSFNYKLYICNTCHMKIKKNRVSCQAVENNRAVDDIPPELSSLEKLEQILISQRIVFEKIVIMPKGLNNGRLKVQFVMSQ